MTAILEKVTGVDPSKIFSPTLLFRYPLMQNFDGGCYKPSRNEQFNGGLRLPTVVSGGATTTESVLVASVGADSHILSPPNVPYQMVRNPHTISPVAPLPTYPPVLTSGHSDVIINSDKLSKMSNLATTQPMALTLQTVDTPTGQCFLLTNEGQTLSLSNNNLPPRSLQSATFIPFNRIEGLPCPSGARVTVLPAFTRSSSNDDSNSNESATSQPKDKRRASHNEVEKRRRDKINQWIDRLRHFLPGVEEDEFASKASCSKGGILAKTVEFIEQLKQTNQSLTAALSNIPDAQTCNPNINNQQTNTELELLSRENQILRKHLEDLKLPLPAGITGRINKRGNCLPMEPSTPSKVMRIDHGTGLTPGSSSSSISSIASSNSSVMA